MIIAIIGKLSSIFIVTPQQRQSHPTKDVDQEFVPKAPVNKWRRKLKTIGFSCKSARMSKTSKMEREYPCSNEKERVKNKVLFLFSTLLAKHLKCKKRSCRKISERLCNICYLEKMKKPNHKILQRSHCPWGIFRAYLRMVFTESGITHIMKSIFY